MLDAANPNAPKKEKGGGKKKSGGKKKKKWGAKGPMY